MPEAAPTIEAIRANRRDWATWCSSRRSGIWWTTPWLPAIGAATRFWLKEELYQQTGSFKPRISRPCSILGPVRVHGYPTWGPSRHTTQF